MKCAKCGNALQAGERFCGECGTPVTVETPVPVAVPPASAPNPVRQGVTPPPVMPPPAASRRDIFLGIGGTAIVASGLTYLVTRGPSASSPATPTLAPTIPVPTRAPAAPAPTAAPAVAPTIPVPPTPTPSGPKRLVVDASGSGDYKTIAAAYANAKPGEIIVVRPGTYTESLKIKSDVRIVGEGGRSKVIVEGAPGASVFTFEGGSATLTGMTIRGVGTGSSGAIDVTGGTPVIEDCDLTSKAGSAVYIFRAGANPVIRNCTIRDSVVCGVLVFMQGQGTIEKCVISGNGLSGVAISEGGNATVRDCQINGNKAPGVYVYEQGQGTFTGNTLTGNARGAWDIASDAGRVTRTGNTPNA